MGGEDPTEDVKDGAGVGSSGEEDERDCRVGGNNPSQAGRRGGADAERYDDGSAEAAAAREQAEAAAAAAREANREAEEKERKARSEWVRKLMDVQRELRELHTGLGATQARLRAAYASNPLLLPPNLVTARMRGRLLRLLGECMDQTCADLVRALERGRGGDVADASCSTNAGVVGGARQLSDGEGRRCSDGGTLETGDHEGQPRQQWLATIEASLAWLDADAVMSELRPRSRRRRRSSSGECCPPRRRPPPTGAPR